MCFLKPVHILRGYPLIWNTKHPGWKQHAYLIGCTQISWHLACCRALACKREKNITHMDCSRMVCCFQWMIYENPFYFQVYRFFGKLFEMACNMVMLYICIQNVRRASIDGLAQDFGNSSALGMNLPQSCGKPSIYCSLTHWVWVMHICVSELDHHCFR